MPKPEGWCIFNNNYYCSTCQKFIPKLNKADYFVDSAGKLRHKKCRNRLRVVPHGHKSRKKRNERKRRYETSPVHSARLLLRKFVRKITMKIYGRTGKVHAPTSQLTHDKAPRLTVLSFVCCRFSTITLLHHGLKCTEVWM